MGSNYLYNGVGPLLDINTVYTPELQKTYPHAVIYKKTSGADYMLFLFSIAPFVDLQVEIPMLYAADGCIYSTFLYYCDNDNWQAGIESEEIIGLSLVTQAKYVLWCNTDILNEDGTLYLAASDPIPVGSAPDQDPASFLTGLRMGQIVRAMRP